VVSGIEGPHQIVWRDRLYVVRDVLGHWVETGPWWRSVAALRVHGTDPPVGSPARTGPGPEAPAGLRDIPLHDPPQDPPHDGDRAATVLDEGGDREVWRVEVAAGRQGSTAVLDVALDAADGRWRLVHAHD
jgi:hypothetical protein